jgi:mono/diheme cytochrome c family protein
LILAVLLIGGCGEAPNASLREGRTIYGDRCSVCHGARGQGEIGPDLAGVVATWPSCTDQQEWIALGSEGWRSVHGQTYGATSKVIEGGMPAHSGTLTPDEIAAVAAFERVEYGGADLDSTFRECGVAAK